MIYKMVSKRCVCECAGERSLSVAVTRATTEPVLTNRCLHLHCVVFAATIPAAFVAVCTDEYEQRTCWFSSFLGTSHYRLLILIHLLLSDVTCMEAIFRSATTIFGRVDSAWWWSFSDDS